MEILPEITIGITEGVEIRLTIVTVTTERGGAEAASVSSFTIGDAGRTRAHSRVGATTAGILPCD